MIKEIEKTAEEKMTKTIGILKKDLAALKAGRANPAMLDRITVEYYGVETPLNQLANISAPEPRVMTIQPWDSKTIGLIEKAILKSDLGITPTNDGKIIRLVVPQLTEERRKELVKVVKKMGEEAKVAVRNTRRDAIDSLKKLKKDNKITEDELKKSEDDMQKCTDKAIKEIDKILESKEKEIMEV
ncbi:ribosome recycling factor [Lutispora thermophila]|uniref:Ribosome-recycling factor n=1 Tax=Lutispora thermophila DSM 19022 TaxID=1122184 RepID=A0A1M6I460_9FIRM|nr:ribosome recycling factor [Lutispora thermophila]SHJ29246.1 ribosome recycling factor [Lutispora thermophila DSM 19022]